jgi:sulfate transport system permease protein
VLGYLLFVLLGPLGMIFYKAFETGLAPVWHTLTEPDVVSAFKVTLIATAIAVPVNTVFGVLVGLLIVRRRFPGKGLLNGFIDLPIAISPVVVGVCIVLLYHPGGWLGGRFTGIGQSFQVLYAMPSIVLATIFASVPFVAREVIPTLRELGTEQEQAAATLGAKRWQRFWMITLPAIRWAIVYGVVLTTARALGEYGTVAVVSGNIIGKTWTATVAVQQLLENFNTAGGYAVSLVLATIAVLVLVAMTVIRPRGSHQ